MIAPRRVQTSRAKEDRERAIAFGEALRAIWLHVGLDMVSPPSARMLEVFEIAYRKLGNALKDFTPQDFTLYAMSLLLADLEDQEHIENLKRGASRYLLDTRSQLSPELRTLIPETDSGASAAQVRRGHPDSPPETDLNFVQPASDRRKVAATTGNGPRPFNSVTAEISFTDIEPMVLERTPELNPARPAETVYRHDRKSRGVKSDAVRNRSQTTTAQGKNRIGVSFFIIAFALILAAFSAKW